MDQGQSRLYASKILSCLDEAIALIDPDFIIQYHNEAFKKVSQNDIPEITGKLVKDLFNADYYHKILSPKLERCFRGEKLEYLDYLDNFRNESKWYEISLNPCCQDEKINGVVAHFKEINREMFLLEQYRKVENDWHRVFDSLNEPLIIISKDYQIEEINEKASRILGLNRSELVGEKCYQYLKHKDIPCEHCCINEKIKNGNPQVTRPKQKDYEPTESSVIPIYKNGELYPCLLNKKDTANCNNMAYNGHKYSTTESNRLSQTDYVSNGYQSTPAGNKNEPADVSQIDQTDNQLEKLYFMVEHSIDPAYLIKSNGRVEYLNQAAQKLEGHLHGKLSNLSNFDLNPNVENREWWDNHWQETKKKGVKRFETFHKTKNGEEIPLEITTNHIELDGEEYHASFVRDLRAQRKYEQEFRRGKQLLRTILQAVPDKILVLSEKCIYKEVFTSQKGHLPDSVNNLIGQSVYNYVSADIGDEIMKKIAEVIESKSIKQMEYPLKIHDQLKWFQGYIAPLDYDKGRNVLWVAREISNQKKYIEELRKAKRKAEESDLLKSAFLANMSHEIRTPLNGIMGFAQLLQQKNTEEKINFYAQVIQNRSYDLLDLINSILDISRIDSGQLALNISDIHVNELLKDLASQFQSKLNKSDKKDISLRLEVEESKQILIKADDFRLRQIFKNLLDNAIKFTDKGSIGFGYTCDDREFITFYVRDTGIGIAKEQQDLIFDHFRQIDIRDTRAYGGTGLGLSICKGLIELMNGKIWVESKEKEGSTFFFKIPVQVSGVKHKHRHSFDELSL